MKNTGERRKNDEKATFVDNNTNGLFIDGLWK
jgi:hypothetical protein